MNWDTIREQYPNKWVLLEAIDAHSSNGRRIINRSSVVNYFNDSKEALSEYKELHKNSPDRELYVVHTSKQDLQVVERKWLGVRV